MAAGPQLVERPGLLGGEEDQRCGASKVVGKEAPRRIEHDANVVDGAWAAACEPAWNRARLAAVATLAIKLLGELVVERDEHVVALPPSRKTRALLAYLLLTGRPHRREALCELFWDVTDDPRGALRWSLSKLRALTDDETTRIEAGREEVTLHIRGASVDALEVRNAIRGRSLENLSIEELERHVARFRGELLEGLELPDFDAYQAWCVSQREEMRSIRLSILDELVHRLRVEPSRVIDYARLRVQLDPHHAHPRADLIRILAAMGHRDEARAHIASGTRLAEEAGGPAALAEVLAAARELDSAARHRPVSRAVEPERVRHTAVEELQRKVAEGWRDHLSSSPQPTPVAPALMVAGTLVGRDGELALMDAFHARAGFRALAVLGEPGIGKTCLLAAWAKRRPRVVTGRALEGDAGHPYGPWQEALRALGHTDLFASPADQARLFDSITATLVEAAPIAIVIDDAQWLDRGSTSLLAHIARACRGHDVAIAIGARGGEIADNPSLERVLTQLRQADVLVELELGQLDAAAVASLVRSINHRVDVERVVAQSGGNPLFALELARSDAATDVLPETVAAAVRDRLLGLPDDATNVLRWASVIGRGITLEALEASTGLDGEMIVDALELLARRSLLATDRGGAVSFAHDLVRRVVYEALSEPRRRLMHRRIAQSLATRATGDVDVALVAHHAALAHDSALATETCLAAARRSLRVFANVDAFAVARRGLRHVDGLHEPDRTKRTIELVEVSLQARIPDDYEVATKQLLALAEHALDLGCIEHARIGYHLASWLRWEKGAWSDAHKMRKQAQLISSRATSEREQIIGIAEAAYCLALLDKDLGEAQALALEAAARGKLANVQAPSTHAALAMLHLHQGEISEARAQFHTALQLARLQRDHAHEFMSLEHLVELELDCGDASEALDRATELAALGTRMREGSEGPCADGLLALARMRLGEDADGLVASAAAKLLNVDAKQRLAFLMSRAAWLDLGREQPSRALERACVALEAAEALERATEIVCARAVLARLARSRGDERAASAHVDEIVARLDRTSRPMVARVAAVLGDRLPAAPTIQDEEP